MARLRTLIVPGGLQLPGGRLLHCRIALPSAEPQPLDQATAQA